MRAAGSHCRPCRVHTALRRPASTPGRYGVPMCAHINSSHQLSHNQLLALVSSSDWLAADRRHTVTARADDQCSASQSLSAPQSLQPGRCTRPLQASVHPPPAAPAAALHPVPLPLMTHDHTSVLPPRLLRRLKFFTLTLHECAQASCGLTRACHVRPCAEGPS